VRRFVAQSFASAYCARGDGIQAEPAPTGQAGRAAMSAKSTGSRSPETLSR
jgi:hypothetical protein